MKKRNVVIAMILLWILSLSPVYAGRWVDFKTVTVDSSMRRSHSTVGDATVTYFTSGENEVVELEAETTWNVFFNDYAKVSAFYDAGSSNGNGFLADKSQTYRVKLRVYISGTFDDNTDSNTYFKVVIRLYYMDGSNKIIVGSTTYKWDDNNVSFDDYYNFYATGYVPSGHYVFADFTYEVSQQANTGEWGLTSDIYITSYSLTYYYYVSYPIV